MKILQYEEYNGRVLVTVLYQDNTFATLNMVNTNDKESILRDVYIISNDVRNRQPFEGEIPTDLEIWSPPEPIPTNMVVDFYNLTGKVYDQYGSEMEVEIQFNIEGENARIENGKIVEDVVDTDTSYFIVARYENLEERQERFLYAPREVEPIEGEALKRIADLEELVKKVDNDLNGLVGDVSQEELNELMDLYEDWEVGESVNVGEIRKYANKLYRVIQAHTTQADWTPDSVPALWNEYTPPTTEDGEEIIPDFKQPQGAHDAYKKGDKVTFEGKIYESLIDNNAYSPSEYAQGWKLIEG